MSYIKAINGTIIKYPYTRDDLTGDNPNVSFPANPTEGDLKPFNTFIVSSVERPSVEDPRTQKVEGKIPTFQNGRWQESWSIRPATQEEINAYDLANAPGTNWEAFKIAVIQSSGVNSAFLSALTSAPIAVSMLSAALTDITNTRGPQNFITAWSELIQKNLVSSETIAELIQLATESNLPQEFIDAI